MSTASQKSEDVKKNGEKMTGVWIFAPGCGSSSIDFYGFLVGKIASNEVIK